MQVVSGSRLSEVESLVVPEGLATYRVLGRQKRRISPEAGRALEILGHAIEYLVDEFLFEFEDVPIEWRSGRIQSIQLLVSVNRQIYFECPTVPTIKERFHGFLSTIENWIFKVKKHSV
jgi:hypothetical protein